MAFEHISFIHNYCNRWCDRCPLGHRCAVKAASSSSGGESEDQLSDFIEALSFGNVADVGEVEGGAGSEMSFDQDLLSYLEELSDESDDSKMSSLGQVAKSDLLGQARHCGKAIDLLCKRLSPYLREYPMPSSEGLNWRQLLEAEGEFHRLQNYFDILRWYRYPLEVKTGRALSGQADEEDDDDPVQNDWNGSAKVVKIAVAHCMGAAQGLLATQELLEDELLVLLRELQRFDKMLDEKFPRAEEFIRPGFDTLGISENLGV